MTQPLFHPNLGDVPVAPDGDLVQLLSHASQTKEDILKWHMLLGHLAGAEGRAVSAHLSCHLAM